MSSPSTASSEVLSWTNQDPRESQLFNSWGVLYRFQVGYFDAFSLTAVAHIYLCRRLLALTALAPQHSSEPSEKIKKNELQDSSGHRTVALDGRRLAKSDCPLFRALAPLTNIPAQNTVSMVDLVQPDSRVHVSIYTIIFSPISSPNCTGCPGFQRTRRPSVPMDAEL